MMTNVLKNGFDESTSTPEFSREMASMLRSDLVITCSDYEYMRLKTKLNIHHVALLTFFHETPPAEID